MDKFILIGALCGTLMLQGEEVDVTKPLITHIWLPPSEYSCFLGIDPVLPSHFVTKRKGDISVMGPKDVVDQYFQDPASIKGDCIVATFIVGLTSDPLLSPAILRGALEPIDKNPVLIEGQWGQYRYLQVRYKESGIQRILLHVGLNDYSKSVMQFQLAYGSKTPSEEALKLWDTFVKETKELPEALLLKAKGFEMHPGYTIINVGGLHAKVYAEKRSSDGALQYAFVPLEPGISVSFKKPSLRSMQTNWHHGDPLLEIPSVVTASHKSNVVADLMIPVLIEEKREFSSVPVMKKNVNFGLLN